MRRAVALVLLAAALGTSSCASEAAPPPDVYHITAERDGETIQVRLGQVVALLLETKAGSPAHWEPIVSDPDVLAQEGSRGLISPRSGDIVIAGAPGYERILFHTLRPGSTRLRATRVRPAREGGGTQVFDVTVQVVAPTSPP